jgi:NADH-quinone oxidoreductase subunit E
MLSDEEIRALEKERTQYPQVESACVEALKIVQRRQGWVSDESVRDIAGILGMTVAEVDSVSTFYPLIFRRPVGRHVILMCDSVSCWVMGYAAAYRRLSEKLGIRWGETTDDGRFTLLPSSCLGACDHAPAMMIDDDLVADWDSADIDQLLARYP